MDYDQLYKLYVVDELSSTEIASITGRTAPNVCYYINKYNIPMRSLSEARRLAIDTGRSHDHSSKIRKAWKRGCYDSPEYREKVSDGVRQSRIWMDTSGENNPNWKGGVSFEKYPPEFSDDLKLAVRSRDNYTCASCGYSGMDVHHIDYDKTHNSVDNCITLCRSCHSKTNGNREYWERVFSDIIHNRRRGIPWLR